MAATLRKILRLRDMIAELKLENKTAETIIENWDAESMNKAEVDFFEEIYRRNLRLNMLGKDLEAAMTKYQKLSNVIKFWDPEQAAEAEQIYRKLQKTATTTEESGTSEEDQRPVGNIDELNSLFQSEKANQRWTFMENDTEEEDEEEDLTTSTPKQPSSELNQELPNDGWDTSFKEEPSSIPNAEAKTDDWEAAFYEDRSTTLEPEASTDDGDTAFKEETSSTSDSEPPTDGWDTAFRDDSYDGDSSDVFYDAEPDHDSDEEIILFQSRLVHDQHPEVQNEFWDIVEGSHMCGFCAQVLTVFQCPKFELCGMRVCEDCRRVPVRNR